MNMSYIILSISWLVDKCVFYDDKSNSYQSKHEGQNIKLLPSKHKLKSIGQKLVAFKFPRLNETDRIRSTDISSKKDIKGS